MNGSGTPGAGWPVVLTGPLVLLASYAIGWAVARSSMAIGLWRARRSEGADWVERARMVYPARRMVTLDAIYVLGLLFPAIAFGAAPRLGLAPIAWGLLGGLAAMLAVLAVADRLEWRIRGMDAPGEVRRPGVSLSWIMGMPVLIPFLVLMAVMPTRWGWGASTVLAAGVAATTFHVVGGWLIPLRWLRLVRPASPRLAAIVDRTAGRVGVQPRATYELASHTTNALAWPVPRLLIFTGPILDVLDDDELAAITAHELGHLDEPWAVYLTRIVSSYILVIMTTFVPLTVSFGLLAGLAPMLFMLVLVVVMRRVGRRMEERSDRLGREHEGEDTGTYARALESIYRANLYPAVMRGKKNIHPHLYDRLIAAGVTPDYPRPAPPPRVGLALLPTLILAAVVFWVIANPPKHGVIDPTGNTRDFGQPTDQ